VIGVMASHPRAPDVQALLVESDDNNIRVARDRIVTAGITGVEVLKPMRGSPAPIATRYQRTS
jgi:hypothetical protein